MSGIGPSELIVLVVVGLLILGPERLPRVATQIGRWVGRARRTANQLRYQLEREITLADIEGKKKDEAKKKKDEEKKKQRESAESEHSGVAPDESETAHRDVSDSTETDSIDDSVPGESSADAESVSDKGSDGDPKNS